MKRGLKKRKAEERERERKKEIEKADWLMGNLLKIHDHQQ